MRSNEKVGLATLAAIAVMLLTFHFFQPAISPSSQLNSRASGRGAIKAVGINVYSDPSLNTALSLIDWDVLEAGASRNFTCYIKNTGNSAVILVLSTSEWNPLTASQFIGLKWDYAGGSIVPNGVIKVTFTLTISTNVSGITDFSFDTIIACSRV